ncbi:MAG: hypothetical protein QNJ68_15020 [Microcoleaceae cyanobacterium MO_207.B10]|nr:hypothetical protein [Microcoleaceae cyanobacterium MO_207.B10]
MAKVWLRKVLIKTQINVYELWQVLSEVLGEELNKSNFCATVERLGIANYQSPVIGNNVRVNSINICPNLEKLESENRDVNNE